MPRSHPPASLMDSPLAIMALLGTLAIASPSPAVSADEPIRKPTVTVAEVREHDMLARVSVSGTLVARNEVLVNTQIAGVEIRRILVEVGDTVSRGDVLIELDSEALQAELSSAKADVVRAEASIRQAESEIASARATLSQARASLKRNQQLRESGSISAVTLDDASTSAAGARASYQSAQDGLVVAKAQLTQLQSQRKVAALNLARASIRAPVDGVVSSRSAKLGAIATSGGEALLMITANGVIELEADVIETDLAGLDKGHRAEIDVTGAGALAGSVRLISPRVDPQTRLGIVKIALPANPAIRIGTFAQGWIITDERRTLAIPSTAVQSTSDGEIAAVVKDGLIEKRAIVAGILHQGRREVVRGLQAGETVLAKAGSFFRDGDQVSAVSRDSDAARQQRRRESAPGSTTDVDAAGSDTDMTSSAAETDR